MAARTSTISSFPAPFGGLNVADSLMDMPPTDATVIRNMFSRPYGLEVRKGNVRHATGLGTDAPVETLVSHDTAHASSSTRLYAFAGTEMFEVTDPGDDVRVASLTGLTNAVWNGVSISNASGLNQTLYNGADNGIWIKDDFTIARISQDLTGTPPAGTIYGVDPKKLIGGTVHQKRVWLVEENSTKAWYLAPEAIYGVATMFDFGSIFQRGGSLMAVASWTLDSGAGLDDVFVAISTMGDIAIYSGTDPAGSHGSGPGGIDWYLKGVFKTAAPINSRCVVKIEGDLAILTKSGLMSLGYAISEGDMSSSSGRGESKYFSSKIQYLVQGLAESLFGVQGWATVYWPANNAIVINVPIYSGSGQLVQSTLTKGWSQFDGWDALSMIEYNGILVYGDRDGNVWRAWEGNTDGAIQSDVSTITAGEPVLAEVQTSFNFFGSTAAVKHAKMVRPTFIGSNRVEYKMRVNPEFSYDQPVSPGTAAPLGPESLWGTALWGSANWGEGELYTQRVWAAVAGIGSGFSLRMAFRSSTPVLWASYDMMWSEGSGI